MDTSCLNKQIDVYFTDQFNVNRKNYYILGKALNKKVHILENTDISLLYTRHKM